MNKYDNLFNEKLTEKEKAMSGFKPKKKLITLS